MVYRVANLHSINDYEANSEIVRRMVDRLVLAVTGQRLRKGDDLGEVLIKEARVVGV